MIKVSGVLMAVRRFEGRNGMPASIVGNLENLPLSLSAAQAEVLEKHMHELVTCEGMIEQSKYGHRLNVLAVSVNGSQAANKPL